MSKHKNAVSAVLEQTVAVALGNEQKAGSNETNAAVAKKRATALERNQLDEFAVKIREAQTQLITMQRKSTRIAERIGGCLHRVKPLFADVNVGTTFTKWAEGCGLSNGCYHNYMKLHEAVKTDPTLLDLPLNEAYIKAGIKMRSRRAGESRGTRSGNSSIVRTDRKIGSVEIFKEDDRYTIELSADWKAQLPKVLADHKTIEELLQDGAVVLRVLPPNPQFTLIESLLKEPFPEIAS